VEGGFGTADGIKRVLLTTSGAGVAYRRVSQRAKKEAKVERAAGPRQLALEGIDG